MTIKNERDGWIFCFIEDKHANAVTYPAETREERTAAKRRVLRRNRAPQNLMVAAVMTELQDPSTPVLTLSLCQCGNGPLRPMGGADPSVE